MDHIIVALRAVTPSFLVILSGAFARTRRWVGEEDVAHFNKVCFSLFLPCMFFHSLYRCDLTTDYDPGMMLFCVAGVAVSWVVSIAVALVLPEKDQGRRGILVTAFYLSNSMLLALPIVQSIYGEAYLSKTSIIVGIAVPINNLLGVVSVAMFRGGKVKLGQALWRILTNPLIVGCLAGLGLNLIHFPLPSVIDTAANTLGSAAPPLMMFLVGCYYQPNLMGAQKRNVAATIVMRLAVIPALAVLAAVALGYRGPDLLMILINFGAPVGVLVFGLASQMESDVRLSCTLIVTSTAVSCLTMSAWLVLLMNLGLL